MNDATIAAIIGGIVTVIPIVLTQLFAHMANMRKMLEEREERRSDAIALEKKQDVALEKIEQVHTATNGLTKQLADAKLVEGKALGLAAAAVQAERDAALLARGALQALQPKVDAALDNIPLAPTPVEVVQGAGISEPLKVDQHKDAPK